MNINTNDRVSITEANQNFSKIARLVDEKGTAVITRNEGRGILSWNIRLWGRSRSLPMRRFCLSPSG